MESDSAMSMSKVSRSTSCARWVASKVRRYGELGGRARQRFGSRYDEVLPENDAAEGDDGGERWIDILGMGFR